MTKSTTFKRIALALVGALSLGVLSSGPSQAYMASSASLTLSASSASLSLGETATVNATVQFTSEWAYESVNVFVDDQAGVTERVSGLTTDSVNVLGNTGVGTVPAGAIGAAAVARPSTYFDVGPSSLNPDSIVTGTTPGMYVASAATSSSPSIVKATVQFRFLTATNAAVGDRLYTVTLRQVYNGVTTNIATATFKLSITGIDTVGTAAKSKLWLNQAFHPTFNNGIANDGSSIQSDSALTVSAGTVVTGAQTYTNVGGIWGDYRNASDTNVAGPVGAQSNVTASITLNVSGPGLLSLGSSYTTRSKSVVLTRGDTAVIWADGTAGVGTITGYIDGVALAQAAKTITFFGKVATLTAYETTVVAMGATSLSSYTSDSVLV